MILDSSAPRPTRGVALFVRKRQLTDFAGRPGYLDVLHDSDGKFLYFTWSEDFGDLWVMDMDGGQ